MKLSTLFSAYELAQTDRGIIFEERRPFFPPKHIGSACDQLALLWQRRNRQCNFLSEAIEERIEDIEDYEKGD